MRHDLTSNFSVSLQEALSSTPAQLVENPAWAARLVVEGSLEDPSKAAMIADKISDAYNAIPTMKKRKRALELLRFALAWEMQTAQHAAPQRWAQVLKTLGGNQ
jgi:hypothetical protein